jgi:hypothetical protein
LSSVGYSRSGDNSEIGELIRTVSRGFPHAKNSPIWGLWAVSRRILPDLLLAPDEMILSRHSENANPASPARPGKAKSVITEMEPMEAAAI